MKSDEEFNLEKLTFSLTVRAGTRSFTNPDYLCTRDCLLWLLEDFPSSFHMVTRELFKASYGDDWPSALSGVFGPHPKLRICTRCAETNQPRLEPCFKCGHSTRGFILPGLPTSYQDEIDAVTKQAAIQWFERKPGSDDSNQGIVFGSDEKPIEYKGLFYRSQSEVQIAKALERQGVLYFPNCRGRLNAPDIDNRATREPDFLVCLNGKWGILEVNGRGHSAETTADENKRARNFRSHGIKLIEHYDASECYETPDEVVKEFLALLEAAY